MSGLYAVLLIVRPEGWIPTDWTDIPPAPFEVLETEPETLTQAESEGFRFGFNTESMDEGGSVWAVAVER